MLLHKDAKVELIARAPLFARCSKKQLHENGDLLSPDELTQMQTSMCELESLAQATADHHALKEAIHALDEQSKPFVERIMNRAIAKAVVGQKV